MYNFERKYFLTVSVMGARFVAVYFLLDIQTVCSLKPFAFIRFKVVIITDLQRQKSA